MTDQSSVQDVGARDDVGLQPGDVVALFRIVDDATVEYRPVSPETKGAIRGALRQAGLLAPSNDSRRDAADLADLADFQRRGAKLARPTFRSYGRSGLWL
jgi:hypothetical protein